MGLGIGSEEIAASFIFSRTESKAMNCFCFFPPLAALERGKNPYAKKSENEVYLPKEHTLFYSHWVTSGLYICT